MRSRIASVVPKGYKGKVNLCTGLPIATIADHSEALMKRLVGKHVFKIGKVAYSIELNETKDRLKIVPQVVGLYFYEMSQKIERPGKIAYFDFGTFTYGVGFIDDYAFSSYRSSGGEIGGAQLSDKLAELVEQHKSVKLDKDSARKALASGEVVLKGRSHDLLELIEMAAAELMSEPLQALKKLWGGAGDVTPIVGGGHGEHFYSVVKEHFVSAKKIESQQRGMFDVARGYHAYLQTKLPSSKKVRSEAA